MAGLYPHDETRLAKLRDGQNMLGAHLYLAGLTLPTCLVAYRAALFVSRDPEMAFEAARQEMLVSLPPIAPETFSTADLMSGERQRHQRRASERAAVIARVRALPNPFSQPEGDIQRSNADLVPAEHQSLAAGVDSLGHGFDRRREAA